MDSIAIIKAYKINWLCSDVVGNLCLDNSKQSKNVLEKIMDLVLYKIYQTF